MSQRPPEAVFEMLWDCKYCGQKKLLGLTHRFCAGCGAPQDPQARYFPPEHEKVPVHAHRFVGADLACPACRLPMSRAAACCTSCGSPLGKGTEVARRGDVVGPAQIQPPFAGAPNAPFAASGPTAPGFAMGPPRPPAKTSSVGLVLAIVGGAIALLVVVVLISLFWKREGTFEVAGHTWERSIAVERHELTRKTAWCDEVPGGGRELSRRREQRGTRQVEDGEDCQTRRKDNGDGTYKEVRECTPRYRKEPILSERCDFEVPAWRTVRTLTERGQSLDETPRWPAVPLARPGPCVGCEREGPRREIYTVRFLDRKSRAEATCDLPESAWRAMPRGSAWKGKARIMTGGLVCEEFVPL